MLSLSTIFATAVALTTGFSTANALETGEFYRPSGDEVSGIYNTNATYSRSPCPGLNSLANHGYLPRDGRNITSAVLKEAIQSIFMLADDTTAVLVGALPSVFNLDHISIHNALEHDASLIHADAYYGEDPASVNQELADDFFARSLDNKTLGITEIGATRYDRLAACKTNNPNCTFGSMQVTLSYLEASIILLGFGGANENMTVDIDLAKTFMLEERISEDFIPAAEPITLAQARSVSAQLIVATVD